MNMGLIDSMMSRDILNLVLTVPFPGFWIN